MFKELFEIRNRISLGLRLKLIVIAVSILFIVLGIVAVGSISKINSEIGQMEKGHMQTLIKLSGLIENIYGILLESHILDESSLNENAVENSVKLDLINTYLLEFEQSLTDQVFRGTYESFLLEFQNYLNILREVNSMKLQGNLQLANERKSQREHQSYKRLQSLLKSMMGYTYEGLDNGLYKIYKLKRQTVVWVYILIIASLLLISGLVFFIVKDIFQSISSLGQHLDILNKGQIPDKLLHVTKNEIGTMSGLTNGLTRNLAELSKFVNDISKGNYASEYKLTSESDLLGKSLVNLRNGLILAKEEEEKRKIDEERRNWTNQGHAIFGEILRQRSRELGQLTDDIIKNLVYYLKANQGGLFLINDNSDIPRLELISAFAYDRKKFLDRTINIGDGLIGTVALERNTVYLKEIPEGYIEIESGLGEASPKFLLIVPLKFEEEILGIVEVASFNDFEEYQIKFAEEVAQSIASTLLTAKINARTEQLLNESRKQSEELALQEVGARQNIEEMRAAQELAQRREADLSGILSAVDNTLMKGEYELDGTLISVNNRHLQTMGYQLKEIKGKNIEMFVPQEELPHFRKVWANVVAGNPRQLEVKRRTKTGEELWLINQYTPVTDISGRISRILYLAHDVTQYKKSEEEILASKNELKDKEQELQKHLLELNVAKTILHVKESELNGLYRAINTGQLVLEMDTDWNVSKINENWLQLFKMDEDEVIGVKFWSAFLNDNPPQKFDNLLDELKNGSTLRLENIYSVDDFEIWLNELYVPVFGSKNQLNKILLVANDITAQKEIQKIKEELAQVSENQLMVAKQIEKETEERIKKSLSETNNFENKSLVRLKTLDSLNKIVPMVVTDFYFKIKSVNKKFVEAFKYTESELLNKHFSRILLPGEKELIEIPDNDFVAGVAIELQLKIQTKDKREYPVNVYIVPQEKTESADDELVIYILSFDSNEVTQSELKEINKEIQQGKEELKKISEQLQNARKTNNLSVNSDADALYNKWLETLKEEGKKKT
jgi:PAS domain S-box-containing protein